MIEVTDRQVEYLRSIHEHVLKHGRPPTYADLRKRLTVASNTAIREQLEALERKGCITTEPNVSRSARITPVGFAKLGIAVTTELLDAERMFLDAVAEFDEALERPRVSSGFVSAMREHETAARVALAKARERAHG